MALFDAYRAIGDTMETACHVGGTLTMAFADGTAIAGDAYTLETGRTNTHPQRRSRRRSVQAR